MRALGPRKNQSAAYNEQSRLMRLLKVTLVLSLLGLLSVKTPALAIDPAAGRSSGFTPRVLSVHDGSQATYRYNAGR
jgi:hypothetical protein